VARHFDTLFGGRLQIWERHSDKIWHEGRRSQPPPINEGFPLLFWKTNRKIARANRPRTRRYHATGFSSNRLIAVEESLVA
jgi:hypothetical protein